MVFSHIRFSDKPFMGSVTAPERAEDTVEMCRILFGADFVENNTVVINLINANSPMVFDETMLGAAKVYARANQACIITPFILAGAMSPVTVAGTLTQVLAEVMAGAASRSLRAPARRWCSAHSPPRSRCSRARRPSARRSLRWFPMAPHSWRGGWAFHSAPAARSAPPRCRTPRRPMKAPTR
jgi:hypothetical protein